MDRDSFEHFLQSELGPEAAQFMMALVGDDVENFEVIGIDGAGIEPPEERIQREAWFQMYPLTYGAEPRAEGCEHCGKRDCLNARDVFFSHVN